MFNLDDKTLGWVAGIIEGEGCISNSATYGITIAVVMSDPDTLLKLASVIPESRLSGEYYGNNSKKPVRQWCLSKREPVVELLKAIYPMMSIRRQARIRDAFIRMNTPRKKPGPTCEAQSAAALIKRKYNQTYRAKSRKINGKRLYWGDLAPAELSIDQREPEYAI